MNEHQMTYIRVMLHVKVYYKSREPNNGSVLYDGNYPVPTTTNWLLIFIMLLRPVSQLRFHFIYFYTFNSYLFVCMCNYCYYYPGYKLWICWFDEGIPVGCCWSHYTAHFMARLPAQNPIHFEAMIYLQVLNDTNEVLVNVEFVNPLPWCHSTASFDPLYYVFNTDVGE